MANANESQGKYIKNTTSHVRDIPITSFSRSWHADQIALLPSEVGEETIHTTYQSFEACQKSLVRRQRCHMCHRHAQTLACLTKFRRKLLDIRTDTMLPLSLLVTVFVDVISLTMSCQSSSSSLLTCSLCLLVGTRSDRTVPVV